MQPNIAGNWRPLKLGGGTPAQVGSGSNFPAVKLVQIFSPDDWEGFTEEYVASVTPRYKLTVRFTGPGDMGGIRGSPDRRPQNRCCQGSPIHSVMRSRGGSSPEEHIRSAVSATFQEPRTPRLSLTCPSFRHSMFCTWSARASRTIASSKSSAAAGWASSMRPKTKPSVGT